MLGLVRRFPVSAAGMFADSVFLPTKGGVCMASIEGGYISADGHFVEPAMLWTERMEKRFRDRAPRVETREDAD